MTFETKSKKAGRKPLVVVEIDMDRCALTYSEAPCTADGDPGQECYNTFRTCQDPANYSKTLHTYRFCERDRKIPLAFLDAIPCIDSVKMAAATLTPGKGLGARASVTVEMRDLAHNDRWIDPYVTRTEAEEYAENLVKWSGDVSPSPWFDNRSGVTLSEVNPFYIHADAHAQRWISTTTFAGPRRIQQSVDGDYPESGVDIVFADIEQDTAPTFEIFMQASGVTGQGGSGASSPGHFRFTWATKAMEILSTVQTVTPFAYELSSVGPNGGALWRVGMIIDFTGLAGGRRDLNLVPRGASTDPAHATIIHHTAVIEWGSVPTAEELNGLSVVITNATPAPLTRAVIAGRPYDPLERGTFWGKFKARNPFYFGRTLRVLEGYADEPFSLSDFEVREYIIESIDGPDANNRVTITAKDILKKTALDRAQWPLASDGKLESDINDSTTTIPLAAGYSTTYVDDHIRIGEEIISVAGATFGSDEWTGVTRGAGGTTAASHKTGDSVQDCKTYADENVIDIVDDILQNAANIPASFIPYAEWEAERDLALLSFDLSTIISKPTSAQQLLDELVEQVLLEVYWDETAQKIRLRSETQWVNDVASLNDTEHLIAGATSTRDRHDLRLSRVWVYYDPVNFAQDLKAENFRRLSIRVASDKESANEFDDIKVKKIFSRWFGPDNDTAANLLTQRLVGRFGNTPKEITLELDASRESAQRLGDVITVTSNREQDPTGAAFPLRVQITSVEPVKHAHRYRYKALRYEATPPGELEITANTSAYNVWDELGQPPGPVDVTLTIDAGVIVNGAPAISTEGLHPSSTLHIVNNGRIAGDGGTGGVGGTASCTFEGEWICFGFGGGDGNTGEDALEITVPTTIDNTNGEIFAGGGGGGGGGAFGDDGTTIGGNGGSGGRGYNDADGGDGGPATGGSSNTPGTSGNPGSGSAPGAAVSPGGAGGEWGEPGDDGGQQVGGGGPGGTGGDPGRAVVTNGHQLQWLGGNNPAQVKGAVE